jgi:hypothetical protein
LTAGELCEQEAAELPSKIQRGRGQINANGWQVNKLSFNSVSLE